MPNISQTLVLSGQLRAVQPIAVSPPGAAWYNDDKESPARLPGYKGGVRYLPASTLRHIVRGGIAQIVQGMLAQKGAPLPLNVLLALDKGFVSQRKTNKNGKKGKGKTEAAADASAQQAAEAEESSRAPKVQPSQAWKVEQEVRARNPLLSLLGIWGLPSDLRVRNAFPVASSGETFAVSTAPVRKALDDDKVRWLPDDQRELYLAKLDEWSAGDGNKTGLKHLGRGWEEITAGTVCDWGMDIQRFSAIKAGAVLAALRLFAADPVIGAHRAVGRGEVAIDLTAQMVTQSLLDDPKREECGTVRVARGHFEATGALREYLDAFDEQARAGFDGMDFSMLPLISHDDEARE